MLKEAIKSTILWILTANIFLTNGMSIMTKIMMDVRYENDDLHHMDKIL